MNAERYRNTRMPGPKENGRTGPVEEEATVPRIHRNTFQQTLVGLEWSTADGETADIYSRACTEAFRELNWSRYGFAFTQVFEPGVLGEVAYWEGIPVESLEDLSHRPTAAFTDLGDRLDGAAALSPIERVNLASVLTALSRFDAAERVVDTVTVGNDPRRAFEVAWLRFMITNRRDDGRRSAEAFSTMRAAATTGSVPVGRLLDACTQAVVWYLKRKEVDHDDLQWFLATGSALVKASKRPDPGAVSSWYRGLAMLPAAKGMVERTRSYMLSARRAAHEALQGDPGSMELNFIKTYHESTLKEHMYVTKDFDLAVEAGRSLIDLDPVWSVSHGELGDAYDRFGHPREAAVSFTKAAELGPPYVGHHLLRAAACWERAGEHGDALSCYTRLLDMAPEDERSLSGALRCAAETGHPGRDGFAQRLSAVTGGR